MAKGKYKVIFTAVILITTAFYFAGQTKAQTGSCFIDSISWASGQVVVGQTTTLNIRMTNSNCNGVSVHIDFWDQDPISFDDSLGSTDVSAGSNQTFTVNFTMTAAMYASGDDLGEGSEEEIYFTAYAQEGQTRYKTSNIIPFYQSPPPTATITCNGQPSCNVTPGSSVTIAWTSTNTTSCTVSPGGGSGTSGQITVTPSSTTTYTVTCGSVTASVVVTVASLSPPNIDNFDVNPKTIPPQTASTLNVNLMVSGAQDPNYCPDGHLDWAVWYAAEPGASPLQFIRTYDTDSRKNTNLPLSPNPLSLDFNLSSFTPFKVVADNGYAYFYAAVGCNLPRDINIYSQQRAMSQPVCVTISGGLGDCTVPSGRGINITAFDLNPKFCKVSSPVRLNMTLRFTVDVNQVKNLCGSTATVVDWAIKEGDPSSWLYDFVRYGAVGYNLKTGSPIYTEDLSGPIDLQTNFFDTINGNNYYAVFFCRSSTPLDWNRITASSPINIKYGPGGSDCSAVTPPSCGNNIVETGEQCDRGSANGACPAACSSSCTNNSCPQPSPTNPFDWNLGGNPFVGGNNIICVINSISVWIFNISVPIFVLIVLYAGLLFLISRGDTGKVQSARQTLWYALLGLAIVLIARGFVSLIVSILGATSGTGFTC